jgi:hypothetical protein
MIRSIRALALAAASAIAFNAAAQDCKNRGDLDPLYCGDNGDMVADTPKDAKKLKTPNTLVFTYTPVDYRKDWAVVRKVAEDTGTPFNRVAFEREAAKEADAKKK